MAASAGRLSSASKGVSFWGERDEQGGRKSGLQAVLILAHNTGPNAIQKAHIDPPGLTRACEIGKNGQKSRMETGNMEEFGRWQAFHERPKKAALFYRLGRFLLDSPVGPC